MPELRNSRPVRRIQGQAPLDEPDGFSRLIICPVRYRTGREAALEGVLGNFLDEPTLRDGVRIRTL